MMDLLNKSNVEGKTTFEDEKENYESKGSEKTKLNRRKKKQTFREYIPELHDSKFASFKAKSTTARVEASPETETPAPSSSLFDSYDLVWSSQPPVSSTAPGPVSLFDSEPMSGTQEDRHAHVIVVPPRPAPVEHHYVQNLGKSDRGNLGCFFI